MLWHVEEGRGPRGEVPRTTAAEAPGTAGNHPHAGPAVPLAFRDCCAAPSTMRVPKQGSLLNSLAWASALHSQKPDQSTDHANRKQPFDKPLT